VVSINKHFKQALMESFEAEAEGRRQKTMALWHMNNRSSHYSANPDRNQHKAKVKSKKAEGGKTS
jgi:hypothetical protein